MYQLNRENTLCKVIIKKDFDKTYLSAFSILLLLSRHDAVCQGHFKAIKFSLFLVTSQGNR